MKIRCVKCRVPLEREGAVLLSPPNAATMMFKFYLCRSCYELLKKWIWGSEYRQERGL